MVTTMFDFSAFPTLMTDRLILREFQMDDAADLLSGSGR
jgi:RimJ/RimL family protein N-acetyltransferase